MTKVNKGQEILDFIRQFQARHGLTPTIREIAAGCGLSSTSNVSYWLDALELTGRIKRTRNKARSILLIEYRKSKRL